LTQIADRYDGGQERQKGDSGEVDLMFFVVSGQLRRAEYTSQGVNRPFQAKTPKSIKQELGYC